MNNIKEKKIKTYTFDFAVAVLSITLCVHFMLYIHQNSVFLFQHFLILLVRHSLLFPRRHRRSLHAVIFSLPLVPSQFTT